MGFIREIRKDMARIRSESDRRVACSLMPTLVDGITEMANVSDPGRFDAEVVDQLAAARLTAAKRLLGDNQAMLVVRGCAARLSMVEQNDRFEVVADCAAADCLRIQR